VRVRENIFSISSRPGGLALFVSEFLVDKFADAIIIHES
jgi:hypothetical protein